MATLGRAPPSEAPSRRTWPGPRGHWLFGCLRELRKDALNLYLDTWRTYGDYVRIPFLPGYAVHLLADPAAVEHILAKNHKNYRKPNLLTAPMRHVIGNGLFVSEGEFWLRQRRLAQPAFLRSAIVRMSAHMTVAIEVFVRRWESLPDGQMVDIASEMMRLVLKISASTLCGADVEADAEAIIETQQHISAFVSHKLNYLLSAPVWVPTRRNREFRRSKALLDQIVLRVIESRRRASAGLKPSDGNAAGSEPPPPAQDLLDLLVAARDEESGKGMNDQQLKDEIFTSLFAGHETTGAGLSWACYLLARHQSIQEALHDETAAQLAGRVPVADDLPHLPLATAVFEEALRLYPPASGVAREALAPDEIGGYPVPAHAILMPSQWVIHRHPAYWEEPERFRPERFLPGHEGDRPKFAYFPFGGGPRACIGNTFALVEGALTLAALAQRFHLRLVDDREPEIDARFVLRPRGALNLLVQCRRI